MSAGTPPPAATILSGHRVVVCVGSGGVGKTTTAAALGLYAALGGARTLVLTIDPARRLANALGLEEFGNVAKEIALDALRASLGGDPRAASDPTDEARASSPNAPSPNAPLHASSPEGSLHASSPKGSLHALMLDMKQTFDDMVAEYVTDPAEQANLKANRIYRSMSAALAGVQEYMAVAKLYDVLQTGDYDVIILDTPPTSHALDFIEAPRRFTDFLDHDALHFVLKATGGSAGRVGFRLLDLGTSFLIKTLGRLTGVDLLREIGELVSHFQPLFSGFRRRAEKVTELLASPELGFTVVTAPTKPQIDEALFFARKLAEARMHCIGTIVNRVHRSLPARCISAEAEARLGARLQEMLALPTARAAALAHEAIAAGAEHNQLTALEHAQIERLRSATDGNRSPLCGRLFAIEELDEDVHNLEGLYRVGARLSLS